MVFDGLMLKDFGVKVDGLIKGKSLTREEVREMMKQTLLNEQPDLHQGAFLAAITAKDSTPEEIAGCWEAIYEYDTVKVTPNVSGSLVENCGTGMDDIKTFNISTAAAVVGAAGGVYMAKHGARAITSKCGAVDIAEALGVDVECNPELVEKSIENAGIGLFNGMSLKIHLKMSRILSQIRFGSILNISASLANPALPPYGVRGVYSKDLVVLVAKAMKEIGYKRALVFCGLNGDQTKGIDEISTLGETFIAEISEKNGISTYTITPEEFMIKRCDEAAILSTGDVEKESLSFLRILSGKDNGPRFDILCLNVAPILYIAGKAKSLGEGYETAKEIIDSGKAIDKLKEWLKEQNSDPDKAEKRLEKLLENA